ncbi:ricin-type beta-trefoil lectin domain protein [Aeromonas enteropelogenes]|uniref:ricin-type beta-trefoil lectin domain protein n=1 Tax=Aeromonas enteropelogenes TaxID=29489 RepID=UPI003BA12A6E
MHPNSVRISMLALVVVVISGCSYKPTPDELLMGSAPMQRTDITSALVTSAGFCVTLSGQQLLTQPCDESANQQFSWDAGALELARGCLVASGRSELAVAKCQETSYQWQWQGDRLFNRQAALCLDVAGRRHKPGTPLRLAECFGGANQSFEWKREESLLEQLELKSLIR